MAHFRKVPGKRGDRWQAIIKHQGKQISGTFPTKRDAQAWSAKKENELFNLKFFPERAFLEHTVGESIDRYIQEILPQKSPNSQSKQFQILNWWKEFLGDTHLDNVSPATVERYKILLWQDKGMSEYTVNLYLSTLSHVFTICSSPVWRWCFDNPVKSVKKLREKRDRVPQLSENQLDELLSACSNAGSPSLYLFVRLALATGGRKNELLNLKWSDINLQRKYLTFHHTKNREVRRVPLDTETVNILSLSKKPIFREDNWHIKLEENIYVFISKRTGQKLLRIDEQFKKICRKIGLPWLRIHDLRHLYASALAEKGKADLGTIADLLGHRNLQNTRRYRHLTEKHTVDIVQRMADNVFRS